MNVEENDQLAWAVETSGDEELLLVTRQGKAIRFAENEVRPMGLSAAGVLAVKLGQADAVVGMGPVREGQQVILFTDKAFAKRLAAAEFPLQKRYGGGVQAIKLSSRTGPVAVAALAIKTQSLVLATTKGMGTTMPVTAVPAAARTAPGAGRRQDTGAAFIDVAQQGPPVLVTVLPELPGSGAVPPPQVTENEPPTGSGPQSGAATGGRKAAEPAKPAKQAGKATQATGPAGAKAQSGAAKQADKATKATGSVGAKAQAGAATRGRKAAAATGGAKQAGKAVQATAAAGAEAQTGATTRSRKAAASTGPTQRTETATQAGSSVRAGPQSGAPDRKESAIALQTAEQKPRKPSPALGASKGPDGGPDITDEMTPVEPDSETSAGTTQSKRLPKAKSSHSQKATGIQKGKQTQ